MNKQARPWVTIFAAAAISLIPAHVLADSARFRNPFVELGLGVSRIEPFVTGGAICGAIGVGVTRSAAAGMAAPRLEFRATHGRNVSNGIPEKANAGKQTLVALLGGLDIAAPRLHSLFFASSLGVGHAWIKDARGPLHGAAAGAVELRDRTGLAYSVGVGLRSSSTPNGARARASLRVDGLFKSLSESSAYATTLGVGVAF